MSALEPGMVYEESLVVEEQHTAAHLGSGGVRVLATPVMVALMEAAARSLVDPHLEVGYMSVGTGLDIKHLAAYDEREKVGEGTHTRAIINLKWFWDKLETKTNTALA